MTDFKKPLERLGHRTGRYWKFVSWFLLYLACALAFSFIYQAYMRSYMVSRKEVMQAVRIANNIPSYKITITTL